MYSNNKIQKTDTILVKNSVKFPIVRHIFKAPERYRRWLVTYEYITFTAFRAFGSAPHV